VNRIKNLKNSIVVVVILSEAIAESQDLISERMISDYFF